MKDENFVRLYGWVLRLPLTLPERVVLAYVAGMCDWNGGTCKRSLAQFCEDLCLARNTIKAALRVLEQDGYIFANADTIGAGRGNVTEYSIKGSRVDTFLVQIKGSRIDTFLEQKGSKIDDKRVKIDPFNKEKRTKKEIELDLNKRRVRESARAHEPSLSEADAVAIVRRYEGRKHDPNGREYNPTEAETAEYNEALAAISLYKSERAEAEFAEVMERYPDLREWKQQPTADHYARLVAEYGKVDVEEAMQYAANRIDLKWQYMNPLGYVEQNIKGRKAGIRGSKPAARR